MSGAGEKDDDRPDGQDAVPTADSGPGAVGPGGEIGPYKLLSVLGEGGYGIVYLAERLRPVRRRVALKVIKPGMDTKQVIARFEAERQALALLDHPNVAQVYNAGTTDAGRPYFVMEYVKGIPITEYCDRYKLGTQERLRLFIPLCRAIQHAHQKGIIHRDIKPSNALVTLHDGKPICKIIDFGVAKALYQRLTEKTLVTEQGQFVGTPEYMSPEQAEVTGLDVDTRTDIYSLGVLLYELLTGCTPFDPQALRSKGYGEMQRIIREQDPVKPSTKLTTLGGKLDDIAGRRSATAEQLRKSVRGDLDWIVMKALEKDRTRRYETADGLARDIEHHLNNEPVTARPPSKLYRFQKLVRRNRGVFVGVATVVVTLVIGLAVSSISLVREHHARRLAVQAQEKEVMLRQQAQTNELAMRQIAYASDISLAQQALEEDNLGRAQELLDRHRPKSRQQDLRGWEWRYLWQECRSDASSVLCQQSSEIWSLAVSASGKWIAVGECAKGRLSLWDPSMHQESIPLARGDGSVRVAFSPHEDLLAFSVTTGFTSSNPQHSVHLWNAETRQMVAEIPLGGDCMGLAFADNSRTLITYTASPEDRVSLWDIYTGQRIASHRVSKFDNLGGTPGTPFAVAADRSVVAVAPNTTIHLIDLAAGKERWIADSPGETIKSLALSPDGKILASGAGFVESTIRLWDVATGREIGRLEGHRAWVSSLLFWPDGKTLASGSGDQTIRLWDLTDKANVPAPRVLRGHKLEVWRLGLLPDGKTLVSGCKDGSVCLWDTDSIQQEHVRSMLPETVVTWRFTPDAESILTVDREGHVEQWQRMGFQKKELLIDLDMTLDPYPWPFNYAILISRDGRWIAAGAVDGTVKLWDLQKRTLAHQSTLSTGLVVPLESTAQGKRLMVLHVNDSSVHEWDVTTWREVRIWQNSVDISYIIFSQNNRWSLAYDAEGASVLKNMETGQEMKQRLDIKQIDEFVFSPNGRFLAAASSLGYAKLWKVSTLQELATFRGFLMGVHSVAFSPNGKRLAAGGDGIEAVKLWDLDSHNELVTLRGEGSLFESTAFSPDGNILGSSNRHGTLFLWIAPSLEEIEAAEKRPQSGQLP